MVSKADRFLQYASLPENREKYQQLVTDRMAVNPETGCWEWQKAINNNGYGYCQRVFEGSSVECLIHRLALVVYGHTYDEMKPFACHKCDNKRCCNPNHLYWGDSVDNTRDCTERHPNRNGSVPISKFALDDLCHWIQLKRVGWSTHAIGELYGTSPTFVSLVFRGGTFMAQLACERMRWGLDEYSSIKKTSASFVKVEQLYQDVAVYVRDRRLAGVSCNRIAQELNGMGKTAKDGKRFTVEKVWRISKATNSKV